MNYLCLRPCVLWHFLHFFILGKSHCQSETVSMVTFYNWIKFLKNIVGMAMWFLDNYIHKLMILYWPSFFGQEAGYLPRSFFAFLWTSTSSRSIKTQKKNLANIQPSWPHAWSITHISFFSQCVSGRYSTNPAIWLVPGAGGTFSSGQVTAGGIVSMLAALKCSGLSHAFRCVLEKITILFTSLRSVRIGKNCALCLAFTKWYCINCLHFRHWSSQFKTNFPNQLTRPNLHSKHFVIVVSSSDPLADMEHFTQDAITRLVVMNWDFVRYTTESKIASSSFGL